MVLSPSTGSCTRQQLQFIARRNLTHGAAASGAFSASPPLGLPGVMLSASTQGIFTRAGQQEALKKPTNSHWQLHMFSSFLSAALAAGAGQDGKQVRVPQI